MMEIFEHFSFEEFPRLANELAEEGKLSAFNKSRLEKIAKSTPHLAGLYGRHLLPSADGSEKTLDDLMEAIFDLAIWATKPYIGESIDMLNRKWAHAAKSARQKSIVGKAQEEGTVIHIPLLCTEPGLVNFISSAQDAKNLNLAIEPVLVAFFHSYTLDPSYSLALEKAGLLPAKYAGLNATDCLVTANSTSSASQNPRIAAIKVKQMALVSQLLHLKTLAKSPDVKAKIKEKAAAIKELTAEMRGAKYDLIAFKTGKGLNVIFRRDQYGENYYAFNLGRLLLSKTELDRLVKVGAANLPTMPHGYVVRNFHVKIEDTSAPDLAQHAGPTAWALMRNVKGFALSTDGTTHSVTSSSVFNCRVKEDGAYSSTTASKIILDALGISAERHAEAFPPAILGLADELPKVAFRALLGDLRGLRHINRGQEIVVVEGPGQDKNVMQVNLSRVHEPLRSRIANAVKPFWFKLVPGVGTVPFMVGVKFDSGNGEADGCTINAH